MTRLRGSELLDMVRDVDPLREQDQTYTVAHLASARRVLQSRVDADSPRLGTTAPPARWRRRLVTVAVTAVTAPLAAALVVPVVGSHLGGPPVQGLVGTARASDSGLTCGSGYAQPIPPRTADPRPWPATIPAGWTVRSVFARATTGTGWCAAPSLVAAQRDVTGLITGLVQITGPARNVTVDGTAVPSPDHVAGLPALAFPAPDLPGPQLRSWLITDRTGAQWYASVVGYPLDQARALLSAVTLNGRTAAWNGTKAPGLTVLSRRTGAPYPTTGHGQTWYLSLDDHGAERLLRADRGDLLSQAYVGSRFTTVNRRLIKIQEDRGTPTDAYAQVLPGVVMHSEVHGDLDQVLTMLASVTNITADDPRLDRLALPEDYTDKRHR